MPEDAASELASELEQNTPDAPEASGSVEDDGTPAAESQDDSTAEVDWQDRYANLQPEYTRATQEAAQYRQIIDLARQGDPEALDLLGLEVEGDDDDEGYDDPDERWEQRFGEIESYLQEKADADAQTELEQLETHYFDQELTALEQDEGVQLSDEETNAVVGLADRMRDEEGVPDVAGAYALLAKAADARQQRYLKSKKADAVAVGTAGSEKLNLADDEATVNALATMLEAGED